MAPSSLAPRAPTPDRLQLDPAHGGETAFDEFCRAELPDLVTLAAMLAGAADASRVAQEAMFATCRRWRDVSGEDPYDFVRRGCADLALSRRTRIGAASGSSGFLRRARGHDEPDTEWASEWATLRCLPRRDATTIALALVYGPWLLPTDDQTDDPTDDPAGESAGELPGRGSGDRAVAGLRAELMDGFDVDGMLVALHQRRRRSRVHHLLLGLVSLIAVAAVALVGSRVASPSYPVRDEGPPPTTAALRTARSTMDNGAIVSGDGIAWTADVPAPDVPGLPAHTTMSFSPDGEQLAYLRGHLIRIRDARDGRPTGVAAGCSSPCEASWSPDGSKLAVTGNDGIGRFTRAGHRISAIARGYQPDDVAWAPRGRRIAFAVHHGPRAGLWTVEQGGGAPVQIRTTPRAVHVADLAWAPDGRTLAFIEQYDVRTGRTHLDVDSVSAAGAGTTLLVSSPCRCRATEPALAWSPDGTTIAVNAAFTDLPMLETLDTEGRTVRVLRLDARGPLAWQPVPPAPQLAQDAGPARRIGTRTSN